MESLVTTYLVKSEKCKKGKSRFSNKGEYIWRIKIKTCVYPNIEHSSRFFVSDWTKEGKNCL